MKEMHLEKVVRCNEEGELKSVKEKYIEDLYIKGKLEIKSLAHSLLKMNLDNYEDFYVSKNSYYEHDHLHYSK